MALTPRPQFTYPANGWWAVIKSDRSVGIVKGNNPGADSVNAVYIGAADNINALATSSGTNISNAIAQIGATATQQTNLISIIDTSAGKNSGTSSIWIPGKPGRGKRDTATDAQGNPVSTTPSGDAANTNIFGSIADSITSPLDFLKFIAWIFHPATLLRAVEFVIGIVLMIFGLHAALQARGERVEGFSTSEGALSRSGLGRVATALGNSVRSGSAPARPRSAPHRTRQRALQQRYSREEDLQRRRAKAPRPKKKS